MSPDSVLVGGTAIRDTATRHVSAIVRGTNFPIHYTCSRAGVHWA